MASNSYQELNAHLGHKVTIANYGNVNVAIECHNCMEILLDYDLED
jgi:hypothetical protein